MTLSQRRERIEKDLGIIINALVKAKVEASDLDDKINFDRASLQVKSARSEIIRYTFNIQDAEKYQVNG